MMICLFYKKNDIPSLTKQGFKKTTIWILFFFKSIQKLLNTIFRVFLRR